MARQGSGLKHSFHVGTAVGLGGWLRCGWHAMVLNYLLFWIVFMSWTWPQLLQDVQTLLQPTALEETIFVDSSRNTSSGFHVDEISLKDTCLVGPNSHRQYAANKALLNNVGRAEGSVDLLRSTGELAETLFPADKTPKPSSSHKRSWRRAVRRAIKHGKCCYRGQWMRLSAFPREAVIACQASLVRHTGHSSQTRSAIVRPCDHVQAGPPGLTTESPLLLHNVSGSQPLHVTGRGSHCGSQSGRVLRRHSSISYASANVGGLSAPKLDEALRYGDGSGLKVLALQETRWQYSSAWQSGQYSIIHSGEGGDRQSYGGVLLAIQSQGVIRYDETVPGRVLRAQVHFPGSLLPLEIICIYAPPFDKYMTEERRALRNNVWSSLDRLLGMIPRRHPLLLLGDMNVHLSKCQPNVPCGDPSHRESEDSQEVVSILLRHSLCIANSKTGRAGITYSNSLTLPPACGSRIDYSIVRKNMLCCCSAPRIVWDAPWSVPSEFGWHAMITGFLDMRWRCWRRTSPKPVKKVLDKELLKAALSPSHSSHREFVRLLSNKLDSYDNLDSKILSDVILDCSLLVFGSPPTTRPMPYWMTSNVKEACLIKWRAFHAVRALAFPYTLAQFFRCWLATSRLQRASKTYQVTSRQARKHWVHKVCDEAAEKAERNDASFFHSIRLLSPKRLGQVAGIKKMLNGAGTLEQEGRYLIEYFSELFSSPSWLPCLSQTTWHWLTACPCDQDAMADYLMHLPVNKAVPRHCAAGAAWRLALQLPRVRSTLYETIVRFPLDGVPSNYKNGSLLLLPKPGKSGKLIEHFRPLVLQCPIGKMILKYFTERLIVCIRSRILRTPQFAYLAKRNTSMAIWRVTSFLNERFHSVGSSQPPPHLLKAGYIQKPCSGCFVLSIDLKQAFDRVHRPRLVEYLHKMQVDEDLIGVMHAWHVDTKYDLEHAHNSYSIPTSRGVRQGCTAAPILWLVFLYNILEGLGEVDNRDWYEIVTAFR